MDLSDELQRGIVATGVEGFSLMQRQVICTLKNGYDVIVQSTIGYSEHIILSTSVLQKIDSSLNATQAIVIAPTHEKGREARIYINGLGRFMKIACQVFSSETDWKRDIKSLDAGCHVVISTPDRILRLIEEHIDLKNVEIFVLCDYVQQYSNIYEQINRKLNKVIQRLYFVDNIEKLSSKMFAESMKIISHNQFTVQTLHEFSNQFKEKGELNSESECTTLKVIKGNANQKSSIDGGDKRKISFEMEDKTLKLMANDSNDKSCSNVSNGTKNNYKLLPIGHHLRRKDHALKSDDSSAKYPKDPKSGLPLWYKTSETFEEIGIVGCLLKGIYEFGFKTPTPMQQKSILAILNENEVIIESVTPSGKTVSFLIALIHKLESTKYFNQALVIVQNAKAAAAISKLFSKLAQFSRVLCVDCGEGKDSVAMNQYIKSFDRRINVVIGDAYQIHYLVAMKALDMRRIMAIIVDDADKLFAEGNFDQISNIFHLLNRNIQRVFLCRRMANEVSKCIRTLSTKLVKVLMESDINVNHFKHFYVNAICEELKFTTLCKLYDVIELKKAFIYCNSESKAIELRRELKLNGIEIVEIENRLSTVANEVDLNADKYAIVVSDCCAYGSNFDVELVINYEFPQLYETYKERLGGRLSNVNIVISLVSGIEIKCVSCIQNKYNIEMREMKINAAKSYISKLLQF